MLILGPDGTVAHQHVGYGEATLDDIVDEINGLLLQQVQAFPASNAQAELTRGAAEAPESASP